MAKTPRKIKDWVWVIIVVAAILIFAFVSDWWKTHGIIGWSIIGLLVVFIVAILVIKPNIRKKLFGHVTQISKKTFTESKTAPREPVPIWLRRYIFERANEHCEAPDCNRNYGLETHHIDRNRNHQSPHNVILLCPNHHQEADDGVLTIPQLRNLVHQQNESWKRKTGQTQLPKSKSGLP